MSDHAHGDPRRPDGDLVAPVKPYDSRTDEPDEFGPKVGWGHDAVYRPPQPAVEAQEDESDHDRGSPGV